MQIQRLVLQNFMSYAHADLPLSDRGLVLVEGENRDTGGSNGAGKSALFEALVWGLYGKSLRGHEVSRDGRGECCVYLELLCDNVLLKVYRGSDHSQYGKKLYLYANDQAVTLGTNRETQSRLEGYLQLDADSFTNVVMFPQEAQARFAALTDSGQKEILDSVLSMYRFSDAQERVKADLAKVSQQIRAAIAGIKSAENSLDSLVQDIKNLEEKEIRFVKEKDERCRRFEESLSAHAANEPQVNPALVQERDSLQAESNATTLLSLRKVLDNTNARISELRQKFDRTRERKAQLTLLLNGAPTSEPLKPDSHSSVYLEGVTAYGKQLHQLELLISQDSNIVTTLQSQIAAIPETCNSCGRPMDERAKVFLLGTKRESLKQAEESLAARNRLKQNLDKQFSTAQDFYHCALDWEVWAAATEHRAELQQLEANASVVDEQIEKLTKLVAAQNAQVQIIHAHMSRVQELNNQISTLENARVAWAEKSRILCAQLEEEKKRVSPFSDMLSSKALLLEQTENWIYVKRVAVEALQEQEALLAFWVDGFSNKGVKSLLLDSVVPMLNARASEYMDILTDGLAQVSFHTTKTIGSGESRDKFNVEVSYTHGADAYKGTSGGERRRADIATLFALGDLAASRSRAPVQLRLLDEPFENLDTLGNEQVVRLLNDLVVPRSKTVLVMTHDESLKTMFQNRIMVVKEGGVSRIMES